MLGLRPIGGAPLGARILLSVETVLDVFTLGTTDIAPLYATLEGEVNGTGDVWFEWRQEGDTSWNSTNVKTQVSGTFTETVELPRIAGSQTFEFKAVVTSEDDILEGDILAFSSEYLPKGVTILDANMKVT